MSSSTITFRSRLARTFRERGEAVRWAYVAGRRAADPWSFWLRRQRAAAARPTADLALADALGYRLYPPGAFPEAGEIVTEARALLSTAEARLAERRGKKGAKQFLINLLEPGSLGLDSPFLRLALRPDVLDGVVSYLGTVPLLRSIQVFYSGFQERESISSQLFHCDADDIRQVKIFVLCSRVAEENGPLTIVDATRSDRVRRAHAYRFKGRLTDAQVDDAAGHGHTVPIVGEPGTLCLLDTSRCLHYGSRVKPGAEPRLVAMIQYLTPYAFVLPGDARSGAVFAPLASPALTPLQHMVLTGDARPAHR